MNYRRENMKITGNKYIVGIAIHLLIVLSIIRIYFVYENIGQVISYSSVIILLIAAAAIDVQQKIIPNVLVVSGSLVGIIIAFINTNMTLINALMTVFLIGGLLWIVSILSKGAIGMGDVKLVACIGIFLGLQKTLTVLCVALLLSGIVAVVLIVLRYANGKKEIPFAPFVLAAAMITILF